MVFSSSSRRSSLAQQDPTPPMPVSPSLSRTSSNASNLSRWSRKTTSSKTVTPQSPPSSLSDPNRDPWAGHSGHLTDLQQTRLTEFKDQLTAQGIFDQNGQHETAGGKGMGKIEDVTLLRFLRARKFDVGGAVKQYDNFVQWRRDKQIDEKYAEFDVEEFERLRAVYPMWTGRRDTRGMPIYVYKISALTTAKLNQLIPNDEVSSSSIAVVTFALIRFLLPFCSTLSRQNEEVPVAGTSSIVDVGDVGLSRFWGLRSHLQVASTVASANFPETIDRVFVIGAPSFFPTVFNWAKKWFDPGTVDKIHILGNNPLNELLQWMPRSSIPREYGGELGWTYGESPMLDEEGSQVFGEKGWVRGPIAWNDQGVLPLGTVNGQPRRADISPSPRPQTDSVGVATNRESMLAAEPSTTTTDRTPRPLQAQLPPTAPNGSAHPIMASHTPYQGSGPTTDPSAPPRLSNGTNPDADPVPQPETSFIPHTHEPVVGGIDGRERSEGEAFAGDDRKGEKAKQAIQAGWIPGSGVSEEDFIGALGKVVI